MRDGLRATMVDDQARLARLHPAVFRPSPSRRLATIAVIGGLVGLLVFGLAWLGFSPARLIDGLHRLGIVLGLMFPPNPGHLLPTYLKALGETLSIALLGTLTAGIVAFPIGFIAARNVVANRVVHFCSRRFLDGVRGVDTMIWALIFINVVGLGPFAGVLAVAVADAATFGKLFSEAIEAADRRSSEGIASTGGAPIHEMRFGVLPQVLPVMLSQVLYYFESNTRSATVIGIVGAGGIGLYISNAISEHDWDRVAFLILMILVTVVAIDFISGRLRFAIIGRRVTA
jgi:phosphonate transport system permease protein